MLFRSVDTIVPNNYYNYTGLNYGSYFYWRVKVFSCIDTSSWTGLWSFRTEYDKLPGLPEEVLLLTPLNNAHYTYFILSGDLAMAGDAFTWSPGPTQVDRYWLEVGEDDKFAISRIDSMISDTGRSEYSALAIHDWQNGRGYWRVKAGNEAGWGPFSEVRCFTLSTVGVDDPVEMKKSAIFPNPASDFIEISGFGVGAHCNVPLQDNIQIYNILGELVLTNSQYPTPNPCKIDISTLAAGVYYLKIVNEVKIFVKN